MKKSQNPIVIYASGKDVRLDVRVEDENIWLTQAQIATLFGTKRPAITKHLANIFKTKELEQDSVCSILEHTAADGKNYKTAFYSLDAVISVGYRINSKQATRFRVWATRILKQHLIAGYTINERRLFEAQEKFKELQGTIFFLGKKAKNERLVGESKEILGLLASYAKTLTLLDAYDRGDVTPPKGTRSSFVLEYEHSRFIIAELRKELARKSEASELFGNERDHSFSGIIGGLYQSFGGKELYPTIESKAAHLLYFVIKDHPFSDGNKRTASFLFVYFLDKSGALYRANGERKLNDNALTALALLVAESDPQEKEIMVKLIQSLLV